MTPLFHTMMLATLTTLIAPALVKPLTTPTKITKAVKLAFLLMLPPTLIFINSGLKHITTNICWTTTNFNLQVSLFFDLHTMLFLPVALFITWAILEFTSWYMKTDPQLPRFTKYLLLFLISMTILTTTNNMLQLFVGWEGVGIMSFLLISWWHARTNASTSALQAIIYNRIGDIGLILSMAWLAMNYNTWEMQQMFTHHTTPTLPLFALIFAATGKSAQFTLHPWLPAAMEGPTPVSALLHSSTMVVAGLFLLIRMHPLLTHSPAAMTLCLCLGATTTTFAALCALTQNDIKKIIAFSTSSQLGLMMLTIGLNQPKLTLLHIITHAFFKALLFLCSGSIIHSLNDEQDIRKMGGIQKTMPITSNCLMLGSLALAGTPFLAGFYTKDAIIETLGTSTLNAWALLTTLLATALSAAYSTRLILYTNTMTPRFTTTTAQQETNLHQTRPLIRLATGSIIMGLLITSLTLPNKPQIMTMPHHTKLAAATLTLLGLLCALDTLHLITQLVPEKPTTTHTTTTQLMFFNTISHRHEPNYKLTYAQNKALQLSDLLWYEAVMPLAVSTMSAKTSKNLTKIHTGSIKTHLMMFTALTISALTMKEFYGTR